MEFWAQTTFDLQNTFKEFDCNTLESTEYTELDHVHIVFLSYITIYQYNSREKYEHKTIL